MKNLVSIIEIPTADFSRAVTFYQILTDLKIEEVDMGSTKMGVFPGDGDPRQQRQISGQVLRQLCRYKCNFMVPGLYRPDPV